MTIEMQTLRNGDGKTFPKTGHMVTVNYSGSLPCGKEFDSSYKKKKPFQFIIGQGNVIQGWDIGVGKMSKGEKSKIIIPPHLGYGAAGAGEGLIPPNSQLIFDVELIDC